MLDLAPRDISCPYCGEQIDILVDPSIAEQSYIEDCQVCCRPIVLDVTVDGSQGMDDQEITVTVRHENE